MIVCGDSSAVEELSSIKAVYRFLSKSKNHIITTKFNHIPGNLVFFIFKAKLAFTALMQTFIKVLTLIYD